MHRTSPSSTRPSTASAATWKFRASRPRRAFKIGVGKARLVKILPSMIELPPMDRVGPASRFLRLVDRARRRRSCRTCRRKTRGRRGQGDSDLLSKRIGLDIR